MSIQRIGLAGATLALALCASHSFAYGVSSSCPAMYKKGIMALDFNPGFIHVDNYTDELGMKQEGLSVASFYNIYKDPATGRKGGYFDRDQVALIKKVQGINYGNFDAAVSVTTVTDLDYSGSGFGRTVWPNDAERVPDGVLPFEGLVVPQGFISTEQPGRLTIINLDSLINEEYIVSQSTMGTGMTFPGDPNNSPRFYHKTLFIDMDGDGLKDIVSSRSGFKVNPYFYAPYGELVWFKNPGAQLDANTPWQETVLYGGPAANYKGPDITLAAADMNGDGIPEIIATHFFTGASFASGKIVMYSAPQGGDWSQVDANQSLLPRISVISDDQGLPFGVEIVDLNRDGKLDILATNHQPDNCGLGTTSPIPGRVYALEMPADGDIFNSPWQTHILKDNIRPNPSTAPVFAPGRLAPGHAQTFHPVTFLKDFTKPSIVVGGDEASKVWVLQPDSLSDPSNWVYHSAVVFDINDHYGPNTTQTPLTDPAGVSISTIGTVGVGHSNPGPYSVAEFYIPVFEGKEIQVLTYDPGRWLNRNERVGCIEEVKVACPVVP